MKIVAGAWRGRVLRAPLGLTTRPTAERLRQALFDMLVHAPWGGRLDGLPVLDAFAGTGALGLEALSRGAGPGWFIERDPAALASLRANVAACGAGTVVAGDAMRPPPGRACRLVFLDPPYGQDLLPRAVAALHDAGWLAPGALLVAESARDEAPSLGELLAERAHGAGRVTIWRHNLGVRPALANRSPSVVVSALKETAMANPSTHTTGNDPVEGIDPGGTRPTKPGNPDKIGPAKPEAVRREQTVVSGDQNQPQDERAR